MGLPQFVLRDEALSVDGLLSWWTEWGDTLAPPDRSLDQVTDAETDIIHAAYKALRDTQAAWQEVDGRRVAKSIRPAGAAKAPQPDRLPRHLRARYGGAARRNAGERREQILQARHGRATAGPVERLEGELVLQGAMPSRSPAAAFGLTPSRVSVWRAQPSGYGVDFTYFGATARAEAETAQGMLRAAGSKTSIREEFDGGWTVRFGPVEREQVRVLLDRFAA